MRVLFVELEMERDWSLASIGPAFLASYIRKHGFEADLLTAPFQMTIEEIVQKILSFEPDILALSLTTRQWLRAKSLVKGLRIRKRIPTIVGGLHPTFSPDSTLATEGIDYLCLGEGEAEHDDENSHPAELQRGASFQV